MSTQETNSPSYWVMKLHTSKKFAALRDKPRGSFHQHFKSKCRQRRSRLVGCDCGYFAQLQVMWVRTLFCQRLFFEVEMIKSGPREFCVIFPKILTAKPSVLLRCKTLCKIPHVYAIIFICYHINDVNEDTQHSYELHRRQT